MIRSLLETKYYKRGILIEQYAFLCQSQSDFDRLVQICEEEKIIFSKGSYQENSEVLYNTYRKYFNVPAYVLIWLVNNEIQFYARVASEFQKDKTKYSDCDSHIFFNFTQMNRERILNNLV